MGMIDPQVLQEHFLEVCRLVHTNHIMTSIPGQSYGHDKPDMLRTNNEINDLPSDESVPDEPMSQVIYYNVVSCWFKCYTSMD